jgi:hypothetical protein
VVRVVHICCWSNIWRNNYHIQGRQPAKVAFDIPSWCSMQTETTAATDILDLAKMVLQPVECEWGECQAVLNSWISLLKVKKTPPFFFCVLSLNGSMTASASPLPRTEVEGITK